MNYEDFRETEWFKSRPPIVQKAFFIWRIGNVYQVQGKNCYLLGFTETDTSKKTDDPKDLMLILTELNPAIDYDKAMAEKFLVCARHFEAVNES